MKALVLGLFALSCAVITWRLVPGVGLTAAITFWAGFAAAHWIMVVVVGRVGRLRTDAAKWFAIGGFGAYLAFLIIVYAFVFSSVGLRDGSTGQQTHDFWTCAFFSVITWTTVGYGDVVAAEPGARFFAALEALNGYVVVALFVAALVPLFQELLGGREDQ